MAQYFPRIHDRHAMDIIAEMNNASLSEIASRAAYSHSYQWSHPLAASTNEVETELRELRPKILEAAKAAGFPDEKNRSRVASFDRAASQILDATLEIPLTEAAEQTVWNFITLVTLPDVAAWRYPNTGKKVNFERWLGSERNVFRKLWWREAILGHELNHLLGEDEAVSIMERPQLSGNPSLARAMAKSIVHAGEKYPSVARSELARAGALLLRQQYPLIAFDLYEESELDELVNSIYLEASQHYLAANNM